MPIRVECDTCFQSFKVRSKAAGKKVRCPGCESVLIVPRRARDEDQEFADTLGSIGNQNDYESISDNPLPVKRRPTRKKKKKKRRRSSLSGEAVSTEFAMQVIGAVMLFELALIAIRINF